VTCQLVWARPFNLNVEPYASGYGVYFLQTGPYREGTSINKKIFARYVSPYISPFGGTFNQTPDAQEQSFDYLEDDNGSSFYFLPPTTNPLGIPRYTICSNEIKYKIMDPKIRRFIQFDENTGELSGKVAELDNFISDPFFEKFDSTNYATKGSAALFKNGRGITKRINIKIRAYLVSDPNIFIENTFYLDGLNNWSSDRDALIFGPRSLDENFSINGIPVSKGEYLSYMKRIGYFRG